MSINTRQAVARDFANLFSDSNDLSWYSHNEYSLYNIGFGSQTDDRLDIDSLMKVVMNDPVFGGVFSKLQQLLTLSGFRVFDIRSGAFKETRASRKYEEVLRQNGFQNILNNLLVAGYGTGLGNALGYKVNNNGKLQIRVEPFIYNGKKRIQVKTNTDYQITEYGVLDSSLREIYTFKPNQVFHYQFFNPNCNPAFGSNGLVFSSKWLRLKYNIMTGLDAIYSNGMQASHIASLDGDKLNRYNVGVQAQNNMLKILKEDLRQGMGLANKNKVMVASVPLTLTKVQMNASEMRPNETLPYIDQQLLYALGIDEAVLKIAMSKYDNAEKAMDQLYQAMRAFLKSIEDFANYWYMSQIDNDWNSQDFVVKIPRQFSQEEIDIKKIKTAELSQYVNNLKTLNETYSAQGLLFVPDGDGLKTLEEQKITVKSLGKEEVNIKPSKELQIQDNFTGITQSESVKRFYTSLEERLDKSFQSVFYAKKS